MAKHMLPPAAAKSYLPHIGRVLDECSEHLPVNAERLDDYMPKMTFEMICSILLDLQPGIVKPEGPSGPIPHQEFVDTAKKAFPTMLDPKP